MKQYRTGGSALIVSSLTGMTRSEARGHLSGTSPQFCKVGLVGNNKKESVICLFKQLFGSANANGSGPGQPLVIGNLLGFSAAARNCSVSDTFSIRLPVSQQMSSPAAATSVAEAETGSTFQVSQSSSRCVCQSCLPANTANYTTRPHTNAALSC